MVLRFLAPFTRLDAGRMFERAESRTDVASICGHLLESGAVLGGGRPAFRTARTFRASPCCWCHAGPETRVTRCTEGLTQSVRESGPVHVVATSAYVVRLRLPVCLALTN